MLRGIIEAQEEALQRKGAEERIAQTAEASAQTARLSIRDDLETAVPTQIFYATIQRSQTSRKVWDKVR